MGLVLAGSLLSAMRLLLRSAAMRSEASVMAVPLRIVLVPRRWSCECDASMPLLLLVGLLVLEGGFSALLELLERSGGRRPVEPSE